MSEFERGIKAGKAKAITAMIILIVTFLGGRYGRDIEAPAVHGNQLAASEFIDMPQKKTIY